jgi:tetratricopeptide (TPR) repeat protein
MALSEIEKLERRYAENPHGLTFAPLAEVHRKNGDVQRALDLLKPGLQNHPDYIPASIVLGRCHLDLGDLPAAETAFTHVLDLDGENVIALKALADINERLHRFDDAERWLNTLLTLDRSNDEARDQLARLEVARRSTAAGAATADVDATAAELAGESGAPPAEAGISAETPTAAWLSQPEAPAAADATPLTLEGLEPAALDDIERPLGLEPPEALLGDEMVEPVAGMVGQETDDADDGSGDFRVETSEEIILQSSGGGEFQVPDASQELFTRAPESLPFGEPGPPASGTSPVEASAEPEPEPEPVRAGGDDTALFDFGRVLVEAVGMVPPREEEEDAEVGEPEITAQASQPEAPPVEAEPEPIPSDVHEPASIEAHWSEPMAVPAMELEGAEPPSAYSPPVEPPAPVAEPAPIEPAPAYRPPEPEPVVTETMADVLLQQGHAAEALRVYRELASRSADPRLHQRVAELESAQAPAPVTKYAAADTGGRSVGDALREILAARLPTRAAAPPVRQVPPASSEGAPTRPAADSLSLSSVFGEETPAAPPAVPSAAPERERVSFDDFYATPGPTQAPRGPRAAEPKSDDLDEFHTWLQNLKR